MTFRQRAKQTAERLDIPVYVERDDRDHNYTKVRYDDGSLMVNHYGCIAAFDLYEAGYSNGSETRTIIKRILRSLGVPETATPEVDEQW